MPIFASRFLEKIPQHDAYLAMVQAYNDWLAEYCSIAPDRLIGNALMPVSGVDDAVAELERVHALGFKSVQLLNAPERWGRPEAARTTGSGRRRSNWASRSHRTCRSPGS